MEDERVATLKDWMSRDRDIKGIVHAAMRALGCDTVEQLWADQIAMFDGMYATIEAMVEDIPIHEPPGWSR